MSEIQENQVQTVERVMTIARGLTRKKIIVAQLEKIESDIRQYGAANNRKKHKLGDNKATVEKSHEQAQQQVMAMYQQHQDLLDELLRIELAIVRTNMVTPITIGDRTMTVTEAIAYKDKLSKFVQNFAFNYNCSVSTADKDVERYNSQLNVGELDEAQRKLVLADVSYLVPADKVKALEDFRTVFITEINGELNAVNAVTPLIWE